MKQLLYIFGEPGSGKSTLLAHLTRGAKHIDYDRPFAFRVYAERVVEVGKRRPDFPGTDALSMSVQPTVVAFLKTGPQLVVAEGDRLANGKFFEAAVEQGFDLKLVCLNGKEASALHRRMRGSEQDPKWVDGRRTKALNLAMDPRWNPHVLWLSAGSPLPEMEANIAADESNLVYAALKEIRG